VGMFELALHEYLIEKLGLPETTDDDSRRRVLHLIAEGVEYLSSAGYKTQRRVTDLCLLAAPGLRGVCRLSRAEIESALERAARGKSFDEIVEALLSLATPEAEARLAGCRGTAGAMFGRPTGDVLARTVLDFESMIATLAHAHLIRVTPTSRGRSISLMHDSYGDQFNRWATNARRAGLAQVDSLTEVVAIGLFESYNRAPEGDTFEPGGVVGHRMLARIDASSRVAGVRWVSCIVENVVFEDISFENSSLSATFFEGCVFRNVVFLRCDLRGALFIGCEFENCRVDGVLEDPAWTEPSDRIRELHSLVIRSSDGSGHGGLAFTNLQGKGLFLESFAGTAHIANSHITHVGLSAAIEGHGTRSSAAQLTVEDSRLDHVVVEGGATVRLAASATVNWYDGPDDAIQGNAANCSHDGGLVSRPN
jgi:hypothetical protein